MPGFAVALLLALVCTCDTAFAHEPSPRPKPDGATAEPSRVDLRIALSPIAFQGAVSQSWFGSAARVEYAPLSFAELSLDGRIAWLNANHNSELRHSYLLRAGLTFHLVQSVKSTPLYGTVYAADTPVVGGAGVGSDQNMAVPGVAMQTGLSVPRDVDPTLQADMRIAHSLRLGAAHLQLLERARPDAASVTRNQLPVVHIGYSHTTYWNIPEHVTGKHEQGFRRFYGDLLLTLPSSVEARPERLPGGARVDTRALGGRLGMQGTLGGLLNSAPSLGFAYDMELGVYPGRGGLEGYLFLALGMALEVATR